MNNGGVIARRAVVVVVALLALSSLGRAQSGEDDTSDWHFSIGPYGWLAGSSGTIVTSGLEEELNVPFVDFGRAAKGGFQLYAATRWKRWYAAFDGTWATLGGEEKGDLLSVDVEIVQRIYDVQAGYQVLRRRAGDGGTRGWQRWTTLNLYGGARYFSTRPRVRVAPSVGEPLEASFEDARWDPFIGARLRHDFADRWTLDARGDIGGFGIGGAAQFSWQASGTVAFRLTRKASLVVGYRWLSFDTIQGEGDERSGQDLLQSGPLIGAGFTF